MSQHGVGDGLKVSASTYVFFQNYGGSSTGNHEFWLKIKAPLKIIKTLCLSVSVVKKCVSSFSPEVDAYANCIWAPRPG